MNLSLDTIDGSTDSPRVCKLLRTKTAFGTYSLEGGDAPWQAGESTTAVFWCLRTMDTSGPDDGHADPRSCTAGRVCYRE